MLLRRVPDFLQQEENSYPEAKHEMQAMGYTLNLLSLLKEFLFILKTAAYSEPEHLKCGFSIGSYNKLCIFLEQILKGSDDDV
jgi:hypothetical protein